MTAALTTAINAAPAVSSAAAQNSAPAPEEIYAVAASIVTLFTVAGTSTVYSIVS